jgi:hypothetical protein
MDQKIQIGIGHLHKFANPAQLAYRLYFLCSVSRSHRAFNPDHRRAEARAALLVRFLAGRATTGNVENQAGCGVVL